MSALDALIADGYRYMFVSNADNLGATLDVTILAHFAVTGSAFMMEVCERTESDKKGGHLAQPRSKGGDGGGSSGEGGEGSEGGHDGGGGCDGGLLLRESAQCSEEDEASFQNIRKHRYFNTNNLWLHLPSLQAELRARGGLLPLPLILNPKVAPPPYPAHAAIRPLTL